MLGIEPQNMLATKLWLQHIFLLVLLYQTASCSIVANGASVKAALKPVKITQQTKLGTQFEF